MGPEGGHWVLSYLVPPLLGAGIGFLTNAIAIRMLFRPFTEKRIFGVRVPFTPGVIPKHRYQLAENIGDMVSKELLSKEMLEEHFLSPSFTEKLSERTGSIADSLLATTAGDVLPFLKNNRLDRKEVREMFRWDKIIAKPLSALLPVDTEKLSLRLFALLYPAVLDALLSILNNPEVKERLLDEGRTFIEEVQQKLNIFQKFMISAGRYDKTLKTRMPEIVDDIIAKIEALGRDPESIRVLEESLREGVQRFVDIPLSDIPGPRGGRLQDCIRVPEGKIGEVLFSLRHVRIDDIVILSEEQKGKFDRWVLRTGMEQILKNLESILRLIDVRELVVERINKLSIQDVERILLIIIEKHLTWINIFGAIIGSCIGGAQILLGLLR